LKKYILFAFPLAFVCLYTISKVIWNKGIIVDNNPIHAIYFLLFYYIVAGFIILILFLRGK